MQRRNDIFDLPKSEERSRKIRQYYAIKNRKNMKTNEIKINADRIIEAANSNPCAKEVLEVLFPEVFDEEKFFCKIGSLFRRAEYPNHIYAVFKWNGEVRILNITDNKMWKHDRNLKVSGLKDTNGGTLTVSEFKNLCGYKSLNNFVIIDNQTISNGGSI